MGLQSEINDYKENELRELHEQERFFKSLSFHAAIEYAASGVTPHRKIHPHQRGIGVKLLRQSAAQLKKRTPNIRKASSFSHLFLISESIRADLKGLGELWSYDTALRMAFNRGKIFYPQAIFVQRAIVKGIKKIFTKMPLRQPTLPLKIFPKEVQCLKPFEIENFLLVWGKRSP
jgi:hypothetical protein